METTTSHKISLVKDAIKTGMSYSEYRELVSKLLLKGESTGHEQTEALLNYSTLNNQRMKRLDKTIKIPEEALSHFKNIDSKITFLVITEGWCGDASQVIPVINKIVEANSNFEMKLVLRDDNPELMSEFLTNGNKAIAKFILFDRDAESILDTYGPRPSTPTQMVADYKATHGSLDSQFKENLQRWYNKDKGRTVVEDLVKFL